MIFGNKEQILYGNRFNGTKGNGYQPIKKEQTNEEYIRTASTEELAEFLEQVSNYEGLCTVCLDECVAVNCKYEDGKNGWIKWLKEKRDENN